MLNFGSGALGPFAYVMPALSKTGENAAFYSDTFRPAGVTRMKLGGMTLGMRDGAPFFHCHGAVDRGRRPRNGGHMLPDETVVAEPFEVEAFGIDGAVFTAEPDPETNFKLFGPVRARRDRRAKRPAAPSRCGCGPTRILPARWKPSAAQHGICTRRIHGGVGSTIGARFTDGAVTWSRSRPSSPCQRARSHRAVRRHAGGGARRCADRLPRRHRGGPSDARRQSRADDHGAGARGVGLVPASDHQ